MAFTTFDPATVTDVTLSVGNRTATHDNTSTAGARSAQNKNTGKYYFEVTMTTMTGAWSQAGLIISTATYAQMVNWEQSTAVMFDVGRITANGGNSGSALGALTNGDVIGIAIDFSNETVWFRKAPSGNWNGDGAANPATNTNGIDLSGMLIGAVTMQPAVSFGGAGTDATEQFTANFGQGAFTGAVPSGFTAGWDGAPAESSGGAAALLSGL